MADDLLALDGLFEDLDESLLLPADDEPQFGTPPLSHSNTGREKRELHITPEKDGQQSISRVAENSSARRKLI